MAIKTSSDTAHPVAFASKAEGAYCIQLRWSGPPLSLDTPAEILRLNPNAFSRGSEVLYLPDRETIDKFAFDHRNFACEDHIVGIFPHDPPVQIEEEAVKNRGLRAFGFQEGRRSAD